MKPFPALPAALGLTLLGASLPVFAQSTPTPTATASPSTSPTSTTVTLPSPTPTPGAPVLPTGEAARAQDAAISKVRRLIRDVESNTDNVKAVGNFGAQLYLVGDASFFEDWKKPTTPNITPVSLALRGQTIYTVVIFYGPSQDSKGLSNVTYDITVHRPDGSVLEERKNMIGWQNLAPDERELQLGRNYIGITVTPTDPAGLYTVDVTVHDNISHVDLPLKQTFAVR